MIPSLYLSPRNDRKGALQGIEELEKMNIVNITEPEQETQGTMNSNIDIKQEEDSLVLSDVKTEPQDVECENKTEVEEYIPFEIKNELQKICDHDDPFKAIIPGVENAGVTLDRLSENYDKKLQDDLENAEDDNSNGTREDRQFECNHCNKTYSYKRNLTRHMYSHSGEKLYNCNNLVTNVYGKTVDGQFECSHCNKFYSCKRNLTRHMYLHTGEKRYRCDFCNKAFSHECNYMRHKRVHTGEKPYKCKFCTKAFSQQSSLDAHTRTHTGEKDFKCDICEKSFTQKNDLVVHLRIHTGEKPFTCTFCNKSFNRRSSLKIHIRIHTLEKPYTCDFCGKSFSDQRNFSAHSRIHLSGKKSSTVIFSENK